MWLVRAVKINGCLTQTRLRQRGSSRSSVPSARRSWQSASIREKFVLSESAHECTPHSDQGLTKFRDSLYSLSGLFLLFIGKRGTRLPRYIEEIKEGRKNLYFDAQEIRGIGCGSEPSSVDDSSDGCPGDAQIKNHIGHMCAVRQDTTYHGKQL